MRLFIPLTLLFTVAMFTGCSQEQSTSTHADAPETSIVAAANAHCPIMGGEVTADGGRVEWNGKTIGFCCPGCIEEFEAMTDDEKEAALEKAAEEHEGHDDHGHDSHDGEPSAQS